MLAPGVFARFVTTIVNDGSLASLGGLAAPSATRLRAGPVRNCHPGKTVPIEAPLLGFGPLRRMRSVSPPAPACHSRLWCRSCRFARLQRLAPRSTLRIAPVPPMGFLGFLQGFCLTRIGCRCRFPPLLTFPGATEAAPARLQGFDPRVNPLPPTLPPGPDPFLVFVLLQGLVARPPRLRVATCA